jgi:hypothetical protein
VAQELSPGFREPSFFSVVIRRSTSSPVYSSFEILIDDDLKQGGHFAAIEQPEILCNDLVDFITEISDYL